MDNGKIFFEDSFTGTLKEEEVSTSDKDKNPKSTESPSNKAGPSDKPKLGKASAFTPTREVVVILDEAVPDKKSTVKEIANIIRKSTEKSVESEIIEIESEDSQLSEKASETAQNVKENQENLKVTQEEPVQLMEVDSVETETSFEKKIPVHKVKSETDIKGSNSEKDELETGKSVLDADGKSSLSILAPPATPKLFSQLGTSLPKSSNPEISSVPCSSTTIPSEVMIVDEETRMSAETNSRAQTPAKQVVTSSDIVEESQSSVHSTGTTESGKTPSRPSKAPRLEVQEPDTNVITADLLSEYYWKGNGPFMLQEQVAQFLGIKSFKRKYPGIMRRMLDMQERDYIREQGLASENMCDLGLTAVNAADILDIMYTDFQEKYEEYCKHQRDRQAKELINKQKALSLAAAQDKCKADITEQAIHSAAQWNARFNKTRKETRKTCMDLQNLTVHYPKGKMVPAVPAPHPGNYPVALVPGQFAEFYQEFTPTELNNLPINTMCYNEVTFIPREESDDSSSDGSESDSDSSGSSSSSSDSDSSSGFEDCKLCKHSPKKELEKKSNKCKQGKGEADELIVETTIKDKGSSLPKVIVAEDIDVLVILTARAKADEEIYFLKLGKQNVNSVIHSSKSVELNYPCTGVYILFSHCFSGCDSTSAFCNKGKKKIIDLLAKRPDLREKVDIFYNKAADIGCHFRSWQVLHNIIVRKCKRCKYEKTTTHQRPISLSGTYA
ncbi:unnamed protein product [Diabrotica balteata]|uniref:Uncharacterized protein n=1 Tax=Diabrotica balteata TaxID=107213 RepID=A0A9N9SM13_DIABA|nr:unnamed protein product [Diabrotica balteata]